MTRTKTSKVIAIVLAIAMAFAFMSFSLTYVSAEDNAPAAAQEETPKTEEESPKAQEKTPKTEEETPKAEEETPKTPTAPRPTFSFSDNTYGAPDVYVTIDFGNLEPEIDYNTAAKNPTSQFFPTSKFIRIMMKMQTKRKSSLMKLTLEQSIRI